MAAPAGRASQRGKTGNLAGCYKRNSGKPGLDYEESVEEALCFGWIDSLIRRIDDEKSFTRQT